MRYPPPMRFAVFVFLLIAATTARAQWEIEDSHTTASLRGIHNVGGGVAWASGTNGTVLRTLDDGKTWQTCPVPLAGTKDTAEKLDFRGIQAFDAKTAIVMSSGPGDQSRLYKTTDGCQTWKLLFTNPDKDGFWDALSMSFKASWIQGMVIGDPVAGKFPIFLTTDGGESWRRYGSSGPGWNSGCKEEAANTQKGESLFAASNGSVAFHPNTNLDLSFVTGGSTSRFVFADENDWDGSLCSVRFKSWPLAFGGHGGTSGAFGIGRVGNGPTEKFVVVGGDYKNPDQPTNSFSIRQKYANFRLPYMVSIFRESPIRSDTPPHGYRSAVAYDPITKTWITVGPNGTDISTDDGRNWRALTPAPQDAPDADKNWNALSLPFVVGPHGRIGKLRTTVLTPASSTNAKPTKPK